MARIFGYARVSTQDQNLELQIDALKKLGAIIIYKEKASGKKRERQELQALLNILSPGDTIAVYKFDRISPSTKHLIELAEYFSENNIQFISIQDNVDTSTSMGRFFFRLMASIAELERDIIVERTNAGLIAARARGRLGGRPPKDSQVIEKALNLYQSKQYSIKEITQLTGVSKSLLYRKIAEQKKSTQQEITSQICK